MKIRALAVLAAVLGASACESVFEPVLLERETLLDEEGVYIYSDLEETFDGERYWQFSASNYNAFHVCVSAGFTGNSYADNYSMGGSYRIEPGGVIDIGYVYAPANFGVDSRVWNVDQNGNC